MFDVRFTRTNVSAYLQLTLNEVGTGYSFVISSVLANRLMIGVRLEYYDQQYGYDSGEDMTTIHFGARPIRNTQSSQMNSDSTAVGDDGMEMEMSALDTNRERSRAAEADRV